MRSGSRVRTPQGTMSVRRNSLANVIGVGYSSLVALLVIPRYLTQLEAEAFGLIGFFVLAQGWLALLDMGFSQVVTRAAAIDGHDASPQFRRLLGSIEILFASLAVVIAFVGHSLAPLVAVSWLQVTSLDPAAVVRSLEFMAAAIGLRLWVALYKSCLQGLELQVRLNMLNVAAATLRYPCSLLLLCVTDMDYEGFFLYQAGVVLCELLVAFVLVYAKLPVPQRWRLTFSVVEVHKVLPFALSVAYVSAVSALVVQIDRMVFSGVLPLAEFGYLTTVTLIATGIVQLGGPVVQALIPRLTALYARGGEESFERMYLDGSEALALVLAPIAVTIAFFGRPLLMLWTGDAEAAHWGAPPLFWYVLGSLAMTYATGPYLLQYVRGDLRLHTWFLSGVLVLQTPVLVLLAIHYGVQPVAVAWCLFRVMDLLLWGAFIHGRFTPGLYRPWLWRCLAPVLTSLLVVVPAYGLLGAWQPRGVGVQLVLLGSIGGVTAFVTLIFSPLGRRQLGEFWSRSMVRRNS